MKVEASAGHALRVPVSLASATPSSGALGVEELFRQHAPFVAGFMVRLGLPRDEVDDGVQEVFIVAHRRGGYVPGPARPTTWLAAIALHIASTTRRSRRRQRAEADDDAVARAVSKGDSPFDAAVNAEALARVQHALETLDLDRRAVFVLFELEGESCDEIAAALGIPVGTVYSRLHAARREFQRAYERQSRARRPPSAALVTEQKSPGGAP